MTKTIGDLSGVTTEWLHEFAEVARAELSGDIKPERRAFVERAKEDMEAEMRRRGAVLRAVK